MAKKTFTATGEQLRQVREYIGLTKEQMGDEIGVTERQIDRWEKWSPEMQKERPAYCRKFRRGDLLAYMMLLENFEKEKEASRI